VIFRSQQGSRRKGFGKHCSILSLTSYSCHRHTHTHTHTHTNCLFCRYQSSSEIKLPVHTLYLAVLMRAFNMTISDLIVLLFHIVCAVAAVFFTFSDKLFYFLLIEVHILCYQPPCQDSFHLAILKLWAARVLLQRRKQKIIARRRILLAYSYSHYEFKFFICEIIPHINLFFD
jgi:hypothetical protein